MPKNNHHGGVCRVIEKELLMNSILQGKKSSPIRKQIINESKNLIIPHFHEGFLGSAGVVFTRDVISLKEIEIVRMSPEQLVEAREMSDGREWFVLYEKNIFIGLVRFKNPIENEIKTIHLNNSPIYLIITRNEKNIVKFIKHDGIHIHDARHWFFNPSVYRFLNSLNNCVDNINKNILIKLLEFAFYQVEFKSPGAIIVWNMKKGTEYFNNYKTNSFSILSGPHSRLIAHYISQHDGATFFDEKGNFVNTGVYLKCSERSHELIGDQKGTRHSSSIRYSYDHPFSLVIAVSAEGTTSVYLHGSQIINPENERLNFHQFKDSIHHEFIIRCKRCGVDNKIVQVNESGYEMLFQIKCTTCRKFIYSSRCTSIQSFPYIKL